MDKKFSCEALRCISIQCQNFISIEDAVQELSGGIIHTPPPPRLGQGVGQKHFGWTRVNILFGTHQSNFLSNRFQANLKDKIQLNLLHHALQRSNSSECCFLCKYFETQSIFYFKLAVKFCKG